MAVLFLIDVRAVIVPLLQPEPSSWPEAETWSVLQDSTAPIVNDGMSIYTWKVLAHCGGFWSIIAGAIDCEGDTMRRSGIVPL